MQVSFSEMRFNQCKLIDVVDIIIDIKASVIDLSLFSRKKVNKFILMQILKTGKR